MHTFQDLVESRRRWILEVLEPWAKNAARKDLLLAEMEWLDLAGRPAPEMTLWLWAWGRFPALLGPGLNTLNETHPVVVRLKNDTVVTGYPDARLSERGQLVLAGAAGETFGPYSIDDIRDVAPAAPASGDVSEM